MNRSIARLSAFTSAAVLLACIPAIASAQATITLSDPNCSDFTLGGTAGARTLVCVSVSPPPPGAPTGCTTSISISPNPLTSAGGTATVSVTCDPPPQGQTITYSWKRNSATNYSTSNPLSNDPLPANAGSSNVTYTYTGTACIGSACTTVSPSVSATVPAVSGGGGGGGGGGTLDCSAQGFAHTVVINENWSATSFPRLYTQNYGGFNYNDALIIHFKTGTLTAPGKQGGMSLAEYNSPPSRMIATLSASPCDFGAGLMPPYSAAGPSSTISLSFCVGGTQTQCTGYPVLDISTDYYVNIRNEPNPSCAPTSNNPTGACDKFLDFSKPRGL